MELFLLFLDLESKNFFWKYLPFLLQSQIQLYAQKIKFFKQELKLFILISRHILLFLLFTMFTIAKLSPNSNPNSSWRLS